MVPQQYTYLIGTLIYLLIWIIFYILRKDLRKEMLIMSIFLTFVGAIGEFLIWTQDWWKPMTITGTIIGIEDLLLGFTNGGIAAVLYEEIFRKKLYKKTTSTTSQTIIIVLSVFLLISACFWIARYTSFISTTIGLILTGILLIILRQDLLKSSFLNGILMLLISIPVYLIQFLLTPSYATNTWIFTHLSKLTFLNIPIEDLIFYFLVGFVTPSLYEYWKGLGLRKK